MGTLTEDLWLPMAETVEMVEPIVTEKAQVLMKNASEIVQSVVENVPIKPYSLTLEESNLWHPFWDLRDTRLDGWFLMSSPWPVLAICLLYWFIVRIVGPRFMRDRPAYDVQKIMIVYNFCQTFFSLWIFSGTCYFFLTGRYNWICQPVDYSENSLTSLTLSSLSFGRNSINAPPSMLSTMVSCPSQHGGSLDLWVVGTLSLLAS